MKDEVLRQHVIDELAFEPSIDAASIGVAAEAGVVTLTGHVGSYAEKIAAEQAVRRVKGVQAIAEEIEVRYPGDKVVGDDELARRCLHVLAWDALLPKDAVQVKVEEGWVTLTGKAEWRYQRVAAETAIRKLSGVVAVTNLIEVKPKAEAVDVKKRIEDAFKRNAQLDADAITVKVDRDKVTLEGTIREWRERVVAENAAWSVPGVNAVADHLRIR